MSSLLKICPETADLYGFTNGSLLKTAPKAVVLSFHGLGGCKLRDEYTAFEERCAEAGVLTLYPYYGPWSWMNPDSVKYVDDLLDAVREKWRLPADAPVISTGGSMGGLSALIYTRYAKRTPDACFANCPVCDLPYHVTERPDLPRTIYLAFAHCEGGPDAAAERHSPLHLAAELPKIPYYIVHGDADRAVNKEKHSDRLVAAMKQAGHDVTYREVAGMSHCDLASFPEVLEAWERGILSRCGV